MQKWLLISMCVFASASLKAIEVSITPPAPVVQSRTGTAFKVYITKPVEQCVLVAKGTNGTYGRAVDRQAMQFTLVDTAGEPLSIQPVTELSVTQDELQLAAQALGKTWKPASSDEELEVIIFSLARKLGSSVYSGPNIDEWAAQTAQGFKQLILNPPPILGP